MKKAFFCGVDVSKDKIDVCFLTSIASEKAKAENGFYLLSSKLSSIRSKTVFCEILEFKFTLIQCFLFI